MDRSLSPSPSEIRDARIAAGLSQRAAASLIYRNKEQRWSEFETGLQPMKISDWELFLVKTDQHPDFTRKAHGSSETEA